MADPTKQPSNTPGKTPPPFTIVPLKSEHRWIKCLFYGKFGDGKTSLAGSAVDVRAMRDVLIVSAESGSMSIEEAAHIKNRYYIDEIRCTDFKTVAYVQEFIKAHVIARDANDIPRLKALQARCFGFQYSEDIIIDDPDMEDEYEDTDEGRVWTKVRLRRYRTVIVDSLTEVDTFSMYQLLGIKTDMKFDEEMDTAEWTEYKKNNQMMQLLVRAYRDLAMNVLIVAGTTYVQDERKQFHWTPALTGKLKDQVQGFVDIVGFLQTGTPKEGDPTVPRRLFIQPVGKFDAKSRIASFKEPYIDQPTMSKIMNIFKGRPAPNTAQATADVKKPS